MDYENISPQVNQPPVSDAKTGKHMGLAVASLVLGGLSVLCCFAYGFGIVPGLIGAIFGVIAVLKGEGKARVMGAVGLVLGAVGIIIGIMVLSFYISIINWENINMEALQEYSQLDPDNVQEVQQWMQQFFNVDISGIIR